MLYFSLQLNAINTVHDYYMMPFLPWLFLIIGYGVQFVLRQERFWINLILIVILIWAPIHTIEVTKNDWSIEKAFFNKDVFIYSDELKAAVPNDELCIILNDVSSYVFSYQIDKMGSIFSNDNLPIPWIKDMIENRGRTYMYSDSRAIDQHPEVQKYLELILQKGSINVYKLKSE